MGLFENFPYSNLHNLNLDWILQEVKKLQEEGGYSPENPPPYPVTSVNGQTGEVVLFNEQEGVYVRFPDSDNPQWNIYRLVNGVPAGIQFSATLPAKRMQGTNRFNIYDEGNPPPYPVVSVNGKTGAVVLFEDGDGAYIKFPDTDNPQWNVYRIIDGQVNGIQFHKNGNAVRMQGDNRYAMYDQGNPPPYPVTSVNGLTGAAETPFTDHTDDILEFVSGAVGAAWGLKRKINTGTANEAEVALTMQVNDTTGNPEAYIETDETVKKLLTEDDIPSDSGVVSINGQAGVVTLTGANMPTEPNSLQTVRQAITAEAQARAQADNSLSDNIAKVQNGLAYIVGDTNTTGSTLAVGAFVYVKDHATISEGLRKVTTSISANGSITTNNTEVCPEGGLNVLNSKIGNIWTCLRASGMQISAMNMDLNKYRNICFVNGYGQMIFVNQNYQANETVYASVARYYSAEIPCVMFNYTFKTNNDRTGIYIDEDSSKQVNINSNGTVTIVDFNDEMKFIKVYGLP